MYLAGSDHRSTSRAEVTTTGSMTVIENAVILQTVVGRSVSRCRIRFLGRCVQQNGSVKQSVVGVDQIKRPGGDVDPVVTDPFYLPERQ